MSGKDNKMSLSHRAQQKFNAGKYVEAVDALDKLADEMDATQDAKVRHNAAVARFAAGTDGADKLQLALRQSLRALEQEFEKSKSSSNGVDESDAGSSSSSSASIDQEAAFLRYNYAAALFLGKQYAQASAVLETVIRNMDPVDDSVAMHVCFLYLDVVLHSCRGGVTAERERAASIRKAQSVLAFLEQPHRFNTVQEPPEHLVPRDAAGAAVETDTQRKSRLDVTEFRFRLHLYRAKFMLLQSNLKAAKKEMKSALEIFQKEIKSRDDSLALLSLETDKTSSGIGHPSLAVQNSTALFLKANLEYLKKNYKKCIKLLASCTQEAVTESVFLNNMGCIHFQMGQRKAAQSYFARALQATAKPAKTDPIVLTSSPYHEVMYNNGLHLLLQGQYTLAFRCFHESSRLFLNRPKLWLRMGECCTAAYAKEQKLAAVACNKSGLIRGIAGSGAHRRAILPTSLPSPVAAQIELPEKRNTSNGSLASSTDGTPKMSLPFAAKCFKNAVLLCHQLLESTTLNGNNGSPLVPGVSPVATADGDADGESQGVEALDGIRQKALAQLAYVYLSMYEPQLAITTANELLALPTCSKGNSFLARSYAAEALCMLSRAADATETLQSERNLITMADEYAREAGIQLSRARAGVHVNNATTLLLQGRSADAEESVTRAVRENPNCRESLELLVYVLLKKGDTKKALRVLKEAQVTQ